ncbi:hypothetical protein CDL12_24278 [Handroanthus impetiginosus]|uniref:Uncharacterized protein n=1 Tax=Handroanthus impetiginosus TaxID=429701 RepID=A0A2G9GDW9_9LAMI|nr:hypothetical protein CDL12_24278 [Handroanthus impetiginosus]
MPGYVLYSSAKAVVIWNLILMEPFATERGNEGENVNSHALEKFSHTHLMETSAIELPSIIQQLMKHRDSSALKLCMRRSV